MSKAKRVGVQNLQGVMFEIRKSWAKDGFPDEEENVSPIYSPEAGSVGHALIRIDSGYEAASAREFLKTNVPGGL